MCYRPTLWSQIIRYPVVAPDLNPQEHDWKATRKAVSHNHTIPKLPDLADRFQQHLVSNTFESPFLVHYGLDEFRPTID